MIFPEKSGENVENSFEDAEKEDLKKNENVSGEEFENPVISKEKRLKTIDDQVAKISNREIRKVIFANLTAELVSESARSFMSYFKINELSVTINIKEKCVEIIPPSDFLENMVYYYDENGDLILYESVSNTIGGSSKYYFENGSSIDVLIEYEEDVEVKEEYVFDVLDRGNLVYDRYLGK